MPVEEPHRIVCRLDELLERRGMTLTALSEAVGVTLANLSILKNQRANFIGKLLCLQFWVFVQNRQQ